MVIGSHSVNYSPSAHPSQLSSHPSIHPTHAPHPPPRTHLYLSRTNSRLGLAARRCMTDLGTGRSSPHHQSPAAALGVIPFAERQTGRHRVKIPGSGDWQLVLALSDSGPQDQGCVALRLVAWPGWTGWTLTSPPPLLLLLPLPLPHPEPLPPIPFYHSYSRSRPHSITSLDLTWPDLARLDSTRLALPCPVLLSGLALNLTTRPSFSVCSFPSCSCSMRTRPIPPTSPPGHRASFAVP